MASTSKTPSDNRGRTRSPHWRSRFSGLDTLAVVFGVLIAVQVLPPDATLTELKKTGRITVCMPDSYPPLVTGEAQAPGFDVELVGEIGRRLGLSVNIRPNRAMATDFNPRSWRVTRAQCQLLAGGVVLTASTLSFLDGTPPYLATGWAVVMPEPLHSLNGQTVAFYGGVAGLDRISLSRQLRADGADLLIVDSVGDMERAVLSGEAAAAVTDGLRARQMATDHSWSVAWASEADMVGFPIGLGLWKGDLTLKREIVTILAQLEQEGFLDTLYEKYEIAPIDAVLGGA